MEWVVRLFAGGAVNVIVVSFASIFIQTTNDPQAVIANDPSILIALFAIVLLPIVISAWLSKRSPQKVIVPPSYLQAIALAWMFFTYFLWIPAKAVFLAVFIMFGMVVDEIATPIILGYSGSTSRILRFSFKINKPLMKIDEILKPSTCRSVLGLEEKYMIKTEARIVVRSRAVPKFQTYLELLYSSDSKETIINVAIFEKGKYEIVQSDLLTETARQRINTLKDILTRADSTLIIADEVAQNVDSLVRLISEEELSGWVDYLERLSGTSWMKIIFLAVSLLIPAWFMFVQKDPTNALVTLAVILVSMALTSGDILRRRRVE